MKPSIQRGENKPGDGNREKKEKREKQREVKWSRQHYTWCNPPTADWKL